MNWLRKIGINTIGDLANSKIETLNKYFKNQAKYLIDIANGIDDSIVISEPPEPKGIGNEITLPHDITNKEEIFKHLEQLSEQVSYRLRKQNKYTLTVTVILKDNMFKRSSHQKKLVNAIRNSDDILEVAKELYEEMKYDKPIRLIGIRLNSLTETVNHQVSIFDDMQKIEKNDELSKTIDNLKEKYGYKIIKKM